MLHWRNCGTLLRTWPKRTPVAASTAQNPGTHHCPRTRLVSLSWEAFLRALLTPTSTKLTMNSKIL